MCSYVQTFSQVEDRIESLLAEQQQLLARKEQLEQQLSADRRAPRADWKGSFPWDGDVQHTAEAVFGITSFRCFSQHCQPGREYFVLFRPRELPPSVPGCLSLMKCTCALPRGLVSMTPDCGLHVSGT